MSKPSRTSNLQDLVATLSLTVQVQQEVAAILEEYETQINNLRLDRDRCIASIRSQNEKILSLEKRYSELLYRFSELKDC